MGSSAAGKTGTTNAYRDAWFVGYTGNFVCGVWFGNDDYAPPNRMTGGSLPAMTWQAIMAYAHQGVELKQIPGLTAPLVEPRAWSPKRPKSGSDAVRAAVLTRRGADVLLRVERLMDDATRTLPVAAGVPAPGEQRGAAIAAGRTRSRRYRSARAAPRPRQLIRRTGVCRSSISALPTGPERPCVCFSDCCCHSRRRLRRARRDLARLVARDGVRRGRHRGMDRMAARPAPPTSTPMRAPSIARSGELPIGLGDGVAFFAWTDDAGRRLDGRCDVVLSGTTPPARFWTLTLYDADGKLVANSLDRHGFTSQEIVRRTDGSFEIAVAPRARSRQLAADGGVERYMLVLRLYDTPVGVDHASAGKRRCPRSAARSCP